VKVLDFGLARRIPTETPAFEMEGSTMPGRPIGTASYMAPERILQMPLDPRCDLFSLGVVMYEMATGRLPFAAASPAETVTNILEKDPAPVTALSPNMSGQFDRIVTKLLMKNAEDRYASASALCVDLEALRARPTRPSLFGRMFGRLTSRS
jgi:serine/threonine protein kinase